MTINLFVITIVFIILSFKREIVDVFNMVFNVDQRKTYKINRGMLVKKKLMHLKISKESYKKRQIFFSKGSYN